MMHVDSCNKAICTSSLRHVKIQENITSGKKLIIKIFTEITKYLQLFIYYCRFGYTIIHSP